MDALSLYDRMTCWLRCRVGTSWGENHLGACETCAQGLLGCLVTRCVSYWGYPRSYSDVWIITVSMSSDGLVIGFSVRRDSHGWVIGMSE